MRNKIVGRVVFLLFVLVVLSTQTAQAGDPWQDYENYTVIDQDTTWSGHLTRADMPKPTVVVNGATLTIEKGTTVEISLLTVYEGRIVAEGTSEQPIKFIKQAPDFSRVPEDYAPYDKECYYAPEPGTITFYAVASENDEPSLFRYVEFEGLGYDGTVGSDNCPDVHAGAHPLRDFFIKTALAEQGELVTPALNFSGGKLQIEHSSFRGNVRADIEVNIWASDEYPSYDFVAVSDSNFDGGGEVAVISTITHEEGRDISGKMHLKNNWYGSASGPKTFENPSGTGKRLVGTYRLDGWSSEHLSSACTTDCFSNVLFLPGLESSRLYDNQNSLCIADKVDPKRAWEPSCNDDARKLYLDTSGKSLDPDIYTKEGDILDETPTGANIYQSFIEQMNRMKNTDHLINDWQAAAYDWRLSLDDILSDGALVARLRELASTSKSGKVTLVAHSNGGLLVKALMQRIGDTEGQQLVDKIIFVAVPQVGTPAAIAGMLHGYGQNFFPVLDTPTARGLARNMPGAYNLLPSAQYFSTVETPVATFDTDASVDWSGRYASALDSQGELHDFLSDTFRRVTATSTDTDTLATLNQDLLTNAESVHEDLDTWVAPVGVRVIQIAGWGVPSTLSGTDYSLEKRKLCDESVCQLNIELLEPKHKFTIDGDGTVVTPSALWMKDVERYWVDIGKWNKDHPFSTALGVLAREHSSFFEVPELRRLVEDVIKNELSMPQYIFDHVPSIEGNPNRLQYSLHSPLTLSLYDDQGRHTGVSPTTGEIEEQIPGTYYKQFGDVKYIFADEGSGHIVLNGYETGDFTFVVEELEGDTSLGKVTFQDMPTTSETKVTFDVPGNLASASDLLIDQDGDGTTDIELTPKIGEVVTYDTVAPVTTVSLTGMQGSNNWYTSDVTATLTATDEGSSVEKTEYSLDGTIWNTYTAPFIITTEDTTTLQYFSTDMAGNKEEVKTEALKVDRVAPEGKVTFNPTTQKLDITGTDNLGGVVTVAIVENKKDLVSSNTKLKKIKPWFDHWLKRHKKNLPDMLATLTDESGHTTSIAFEKTKDRKGYVFVRVQSLGYDDSETVVTDAAAQYKWRVDKKNQYQQLGSHLKVDMKRLESHYVPRKNETWIMERPQDLSDDERDDDSERRLIRQKLPGLVVPYIQTVGGTIEIKY